MLPDLTALAETVRAVARTELLPRFAAVERQIKADGSIVTAADRANQDALTAALAERWPRYRALGEEMTAAEQEALLASSEEGLWLIDPLDGTTNFTAGLPYFAVSVALVVSAKTVLGLVYDPIRDECFSARRGAGSLLNGAPIAQPPPPPPLRSAIAAIDFKRLDPVLGTRLVTRPPYGSQRSFGAVALDWCWLAAGRFHLYLHGRQGLWDYAAGELVLREAGGCSSTLEGRQAAPTSLAPRSAVGALDAGLFAQWSAWLAAREGSPGPE